MLIFNEIWDLQTAVLHANTFNANEDGVISLIDNVLLRNWVDKGAMCNVVNCYFHYIIQLIRISDTSIGI